MESKPRVARGSAIRDAVAPQPRIRLREEPRRPDVPPQAGAWGEYRLVHDRLSALERLTRLVEQGALSPEEFAREKLAVLRLPAEPLLLEERAAPPAPVRRPSLLGRLLDFRLVAAAGIAGAALALFARPEPAADWLARALLFF
ncbi:MAG: hypothetical protein ACFBQW_06235 [Sphingomonadaceae bacterium]